MIKKVRDYAINSIYVIKNGDSGACFGLFWIILTEAALSTDSRPVGAIF